MPSRPTLSMARMTTPHPAPTSAESSLFCRVDFMVRAVLPIQKIIQVTKPTATIDSPPPSVSCASKLIP